jgi:hypothetical protein
MFTGVVTLFTGVVTLFTGVVTLFTGVVTLFTGVVTLFTGVVTLFTGVVTLFTGVVTLFTVVVTLFTGVVTLFTGVITLFTGVITLCTGVVTLFTGVITLCTGVVTLFTGVVTLFTVLVTLFTRIATCNVSCSGTVKVLHFKNDYYTNMVNNNNYKNNKIDIITFNKYTLLKRVHPAGLTSQFIWRRLRWKHGRKWRVVWILEGGNSGALKILSQLWLAVNKKNRALNPAPFVCKPIHIFSIICFCNIN